MAAEPASRRKQRDRREAPEPRGARARLLVLVCQSRSLFGGHRIPCWCVFCELELVRIFELVLQFFFSGRRERSDLATRDGRHLFRLIHLLLSFVVHFVNYGALGCEVRLGRTGLEIVDISSILKSACLFLRSAFSSFRSLFESGDLGNSGSLGDRIKPHVVEIDILAARLRLLIDVEGLQGIHQRDHRLRQEPSECDHQECELVLHVVCTMLVRTRGVEPP